MPAGDRLRRRNLSLLGALLLAACVRAPPVVEPPAPPPPDELTLERTACAGSCPVYVLTVQADGHVHFVGVKDVALVGVREWRIEPAFARHLFGELERAGFFELAPRYPTEVEEFPGLVLTVRRDGRSHRVQLGGEGTAALARDVRAEQLLKRLATTVDKLTGCGRFVEIDSKRTGGGCTD
ncbi:MAG: DUF6438 domain-containing protein [Myxococcota bacterium]